MKVTKSLKNLKLLALFTAALFVSAVLMAGCLNMINDEEESYTPPEGMGAVSLSFGTSARTIIPPKEEEHQSYRIIFKPGSGRPNVIFMIGPGDDSNHDDIDVPMILETGDYQVEVIGYRDDNWSIPVASAKTGLKGSIWQRLEDKTIAPDKLLSVTIDKDVHIVLHVVLWPIADEGEGTFKWNITNKNNLDEFHGTLKLSDYPDGTNVKSIEIKQDLNLESSFDISSGYKYVDLVLRRGDEKLMYEDIVHIYQNMTSTFDYEILEAIFFPSPPGVKIIISYTHPGDLGLTFNIDYDDSFSDQKNKGKSHAQPITRSRSTTSLYPTEITIMASGDFDKYTWYNGKTQLGNTNPLTLNANHPSFSGFASGSTFVICLEVEDDGVPYTMDDSMGVYIKIVN
jgi:hypothetical protein